MHRCKTTDAAKWNIIKVLQYEWFLWIPRQVFTSLTSPTCTFSLFRIFMRIFKKPFKLQQRWQSIYSWHCDEISLYWHHPRLVQLDKPDVNISLGKCFQPQHSDIQMTNKNGKLTTISNHFSFARITFCSLQTQAEITSGGVIWVMLSDILQGHRTKRSHLTSWVILDVMVWTIKSYFAIYVWYDSCSVPGRYLSLFSVEQVTLYRWCYFLSTAVSAVASYSNQSPQKVISCEEILAWWQHSLIHAVLSHIPFTTVKKSAGLASESLRCTLASPDQLEKDSSENEEAWGSLWMLYSAFASSEWFS